MPRWADDPVRRRNGRCEQTGQEADSTYEGSLIVGWAERGNRDNISVTISNIT